MKKRVVIYMDIDTEREGVSAVRQGTPFPGDFNPIQKTEPYVVHIGGDGGDPIDTTAHELGHALSRIFELPGGMKDDPRTAGEFANEHERLNLSTEQADRIWSNERLAWKLAEKIRPQLDQEVKREALTSYLGMYQKAA